MTSQLASQQMQCAYISGSESLGCRHAS